MKHFLALMLASSILFSLVACSGEPMPDGSSGTPVGTGQGTNESLEEIDRAVSYGLVPEEIQGDYDAVITFRQYSLMLTNLIGVWDESRLDEWEETIALAAGSDEEM